jgi:hypothetical protein
VKCVDCRYFEQMEPFNEYTQTPYGLGFRGTMMTPKLVTDRGKCRYNAPNPHFPIVTHDDWCGQFLGKEV